MKELNKLTEQIKNHEKENLYGIILVGSRGRSDFDMHSDYDLVCVCEKINTPLFSEGTQLIDGVVYGFRIVPFNHLINKKFSQIEKHAYTNSKILFDRDGQISSLMQKKCIWEDDERLNLFCDYLVKLSYSYNVLDNYKHCWNYCGELEKAINRKNSVQTLLEMVELLRYSIYLELINKRIFLPQDKTLFSIWTTTKSNRVKIIQEIFIKHCKDNPIKFAQELTPVLKQIVKEFESEIELPNNIYKYRLGVTRKYE